MFWLKLFSSNTDFLTLDSLVQLDMWGCNIHEDGQTGEQDKVKDFGTEASWIVESGRFSNSISMVADSILDYCSLPSMIVNGL